MPRLTKLDRSIRGRVAIVTGAASGMGRATAHLFADEGAHVVIADRSAEQLTAVADEIRGAHGGDSVEACVVDVAAADAPSTLVGAAIACWGRLDIVVNNAGVSMVSSVFQDEESFDDAWSTTLAVNLTSYVRLVRAAVPHLAASPGGGRIVNIASTEAIVATAGIAAYSASKSGVTGLTRSLAVELGRHGITANTICPGPINTGMTAGIPEEAKEVYAKRRVPLRRYGDPEEVAHMTLALCLPAASFVNGATIPVDGGMTIRHT